MCSADHLLAEVKVPSSAPGGPPPHSFFTSTSSFLIEQHKETTLRLLTDTDSYIPFSVLKRAERWDNVGLAEAPRQIWARKLGVERQSLCLCARLSPYYSKLKPCCRLWKPVHCLRWLSHGCLWGSNIYPGGLLGRIYGIWSILEIITNVDFLWLSIICRESPSTAL